MTLAQRSIVPITTDLASQQGALLTEPTAFPFVQKQLSMPPHWSDQVIQTWRDVMPADKEGFITHHYWTETGSVNVFQVVGTDHWDYQGKTWLELLKAGKRMPHNLQKLSDNPDYYLKPVERRPRIHYYTTDGMHFYVGADGNHRTCIAKFFLYEQAKSQLHDVSLDHYRVDESFYQTYLQLSALIEKLVLPVKLRVERKQVGRKDTHGWKVDEFTPSLIWLNYQTGEEKVLDIALALNQLQVLSAQLFMEEASQRDFKSAPIHRRLRNFVQTKLSFREK